jgi:hypothetical protein
MKLSKLILIGACGAALCLSGRLFAADETTPPAKPETPQKPETPVVTAPPTETPVTPVTPERPEVPNLGIPPKLELPEDVQLLVTQFRTQASSFVEAQREIARKLKGATEAERELLKEQLKENRETFLEESKALRADIRERVKELKEKLRESRPVDAGIGEGGGRSRRGGN